MLRGIRDRAEQSRVRSLRGSPPSSPSAGHMPTEIRQCRLWVTAHSPPLWADKRGFRREAARFLART